jgi:MtN3 and saliva related transmembrane protein
MLPMPELLPLLAATWGVLMAASPILQIGRMVQRRSSADISLGYFLVLMVGFGIWLAYGMSIGNAALIVPNIVSIAVGGAVIVVIVKFRRPGSDGRDTA